MLCVTCCLPRCEKFIAFAAWGAFLDVQETLVCVFYLAGGPLESSLEQIRDCNRNFGTVCRRREPL